MKLIKSEAAERLRAEAAKRILLTDGAFGTMIQGYRLSEADYAGGINTGFDQKGNNDLLVISRPHVIAEITEAYLDAGSDIVSTNTFNANRISQADYAAEHLVRDINMHAARIIREVADADGKQRFRRTSTIRAFARSASTSSRTSIASRPTRCSTAGWISS